MHPILQRFNPETVKAARALFEEAVLARTTSYDCGTVIPYDSPSGCACFLGVCIGIEFAQGIAEEYESDTKATWWLPPGGLVAEYLGFDAWEDDEHATQTPAHEEACDFINNHTKTPELVLDATKGEY